MNINIARGILEYLVKDEFGRRILFESDYNRYKEGYIKTLEEVKERKEAELYSIIKDKDVTKNVLNMIKTDTIENEAIIEYILSDSELTESIFAVIESYLNIEVEIPEVIYLKNMPNNLLEELINRNAKPLTSKQKEYLKVIEKHDNHITPTELAEIMGTSRQNISSMIQRMNEKGCNIRHKRLGNKKNIIEYKEVELSPKQAMVLNIYSEEGYSITLKDIAKIMCIKSLAYIQNIINGLIIKFSKYKIPIEDTDKIIALIKNKRKLGKLLEILKNIRKINYDNIGVLIDTLLQENKEDKNNEINFVINYEQILMSRGLEKVEEPLYQLLVKHKVKLNTEQCKKIAKLMDEYEKRVSIKEYNSNPVVAEELQSEEQEEMEL